jgi:hypothetical protein
MGLDLANGWVRQDSSSASNVYYGYSVVGNPADTDTVYAIRLVTTSAGVQTIKWTNNDPLSYCSSWSGRTYSFAVPTGSLGLTWSTSSTPLYTALFSWSGLTGVSKYTITVANSNRLDKMGNAIVGQYAYQRAYTENYTNLYAHSQIFPGTGSYNITLTAINYAGSITATTSVTF